MSGPIVWDQTGDRKYETGVDRGVLYPIDKEGKYNLGVAWNGLTGITENPSGAEPNPLYADNLKYLELMSVEEFGCTIEAYTYPDEFSVCDGTAELMPGIEVGQQTRTGFGLAYRTVVGNDVEYEDFGYKLHLIYGGKASPSSKAYQTINDSPDAIQFSWEVSTTAVPVKDHKPTASLILDSTKLKKEAMEAVEKILYGSETVEPRLPLPDEVLTIIAAVA